MKPRFTYNEWYHKYLKVMLKRERENPHHQYSFDRIYVRRKGELKPFYNKRNIKPKCHYSALTKKLMREVQVELRPYTNVNQRQHTTHKTKLRDFTCTINIDGVQCTLICMGSLNPKNHRGNTVIVLDSHDKDSDKYMNKIAYHSKRKFMSRNPELKEEAKKMNDLQLEHMDYKSEEQMFMLSTIVEHPTVLIKVQRIAAALDNKPTIHTLYTVLRGFQE